MYLLRSSQKLMSMNMCSGGCGKGVLILNGLHHHRVCECACVRSCVRVCGTAPLLEKRSSQHGAFQHSAAEFSRLSTIHNKCIK